MGDVMSIKEEIISFARDIKIDLIGFCDINFDESLINFLKEKRELELLTGFEEENENKRTDIKKIMEDAQTIIAIALPYKTTDINTKQIHISKSSIGLGYRIVLKEKLLKLCNFLIEEYGAKAVSFCDNNPLCEREIARKSGIGFIGKNNSLITEKYGSYVFLGEIITNIYIERDKAIENKCGSCTICLNACPSGALLKPWYIDPRKCISFLTQKKEELTDSEKKLLGLNIYGCDTCQDVCPYNKTAEYSKIKEFKPFGWEVNINPDFILGLTNSEYKCTFKKVSCGWRGKRVLKRNTLIALENLKRNK